MFSDMTVLIIWGSLNMAIMMVMIFLWYISRLSNEMSRQASMVPEKRPDRRF
jgi:flagellar biogenesis protein FliO